MSNENVNQQAAMTEQNNAWNLVPRPPPIEIPALPELLAGPAMGGAPVTPPSYQPPVNPPPAPRTDRRRPILNPEDELDNEQPPLNSEFPPSYLIAVGLAHSALNMPREAPERWKLLQNALTALNMSGNGRGLAGLVQSVLRDQHGL
jgi:hypothetical protein